MKKTVKLRSIHPRLIIFLALGTLGITLLDLLVHHHRITELLPEFGMFTLLSLGGGIVFIVVALCVLPLISRKGDYYER
jgi:hypothetical protein